MSILVEICENLQKNVFSIIAEKYNTTPNNIKWNITTERKFLYVQNPYR